jgi:hypothetical protein
MSCAELVAGSRINGRASYPHWCCGLSKLSRVESVALKWVIRVESVAAMR